MKFPLSIAPIVAIVTFTAALPGQDQVTPLRGSPVSGKVVEMSPTEVTVESRGSRRKIPVNEIRRVSYREDPPELKRGRDNILMGQLATGLSDLKTIDRSRIQRREVQQDLMFYMAYSQGRLALSEGGDKAAAADAMLEFAKSHQGSFHFFQAAELLGDLAVSRGNYQDAAKYYKAIAAKAPWPDYKMKAMILEARALAAQNQFTSAGELFARVAGFAIDTPRATRQKRLAAIGQAICLAETGSPEEAERKLQEIIAKNDPQDAELFGRAYNGLGRCHLIADRPREALLAYLHVDILFYGDAEIHAESLYHLAKLWTTVNRADRAAAARGLLADRYSGSMWAKRE